MMPWKHIFIAAIFAFISSEASALFVSPFESTIAGFVVGVGVLYLLSLKTPIIPIGVRNEIRC